MDKKKRDIIYLIPSLEELKNTKKIKNLTEEKKEEYIHKINILSRKYNDIFISNRRRLIESKDNFLLGIFVALTFSYFFFFLSRYIPKSQVSFNIELALFFILLIFLLNKYFKLSISSIVSKRDINFFEELNKCDFRELVKNLEKDKDKGKEYLSYFLPYALKIEEEQISMKSHYS